jgi:hypothetical protein
MRDRPQCLHASKRNVIRLDLQRYEKARELGGEDRVVEEIIHAWVQSRTANGYHLTTSAAAELRAAIRKEKREGSELFFKWLSGLTGLVGALIGLAALLICHR